MGSHNEFFPPAPQSKNIFFLRRNDPPTPRPPTRAILASTPEAASSSSTTPASVELCIQNPLAWLWIAVRESIVLRRHVRRLAERDVLEFAIYNDGVTPGNVLGHITHKFESIYWSLLGLPPELLAQDDRTGSAGILPPRCLEMEFGISRSPKNILFGAILLRGGS